MSFSALQRCLLPPVSRKTKLKAYAKTLGLQSARAQAHTFDTIAGPIAQMRKMYPNAGAETLRTLLRNSYDMYVSRYVNHWPSSIFCTNSRDRKT